MTRTASRLTGAPADERATTLGFAWFKVARSQQKRSSLGGAHTSRRRMHRWALAVVLLAGCHAQPPSWVWPEDRQPTAPAGARPIAEDSVAQLAGQWDLVVVTLSHGVTGRPWRANLELEESDPTTRLRRAPLEIISGVLIGSARWQRAASVDSAAVDVQGTTLSLGCVRNCTDGPRLDFRLLAIAGNQLWGLCEDPQDGLAIAVDSIGRPLPNPAGFFCAKRAA